MAHKQAIQISDHFTLGRLLRFTLPSVLMMIFTSSYTIVDGLFVSNFSGKTAFAALNLVFPLISILGTFGFMMGTGGSALVAKTLGEGDASQARRIFSMLVRTTVEMGVALMALGALLVIPVCRMLGAEGELLSLACLYGFICLVGIVPFMLQNVFQSFFVTAGKPQLGLAVIVAAGLTNIVLDALFIVVCGWGLRALPRPRFWGSSWEASSPWCTLCVRTPPTCACPGCAMTGASSSRRASTARASL